MTGYVGRRIEAGQYDVVISGASCAGLMAAEKLALGGRRVLVLERKAVPEQPKRTWIVTDRLRSVVGEFPTGVVVHKTGAMEVNAGSFRATVTLDHPDLIIERSALLRHLACKAETAGAELCVNADLRSVSATEDPLALDVYDRESGDRLQVLTRHLVGAGGVNCQVARAFSAAPQRAVPVVQAAVRLPRDYDPNVAKVWFERARTKYFLWVVPDSDRTGVLGLIAETASGARTVLDDFIEKGGYERLEYQGAMIPLHQPRRCLAWRSRGNRILLVGDAAAHVKVTTVGGVVSGLLGAQAAARSLLRNTPYKKELRALHRELYLHDLIRWSMDRFDQRAYEDMVRVLNEPLRTFLGRRDRDSMAGGFFGLLTRQPAMAWLGLRSLLKPHRPPALSASGPPTAPLILPQLHESGD